MLKKIIAILIIVLFCAYCFIIEPNNVIVKDYVIKNNALKGIKIIFVSDFHIKKSDYKKLRKIANIINSQNADIILSSGGYLVEGNAGMSPQKLAEALSPISLKTKFLTTLGDNDTKDRQHLQEALTKSSITVLSNTSKRMLVKGKALHIAGVEGSEDINPKLKEMIKRIKEPLIILSHNPNVFDDVPDKAIVTLAGHTHGGQVVLPSIGALILPKDTDKEHIYGLIEDDNHKKMIITSGLGTGKIPIRLNCPPEVVVINFK